MIGRTNSVMMSKYVLQIYGLYKSYHVVVKNSGNTEYECSWNNLNKYYEISVMPGTYTIIATHDLFSTITSEINVQNDTSVTLNGSASIICAVALSDDIVEGWTYVQNPNTKVTWTHTNDIPLHNFTKLHIAWRITCNSSKLAYATASSYNKQTITIGGNTYTLTRSIMNNTDFQENVIDISNITYYDNRITLVSQWTSSYFRVSISACHTQFSNGNNADNSFVVRDMWLE